MKKLILIAISTLLFLQVHTQNLIEVQKIVASDRALNDEYGESVSISGNYAIVGARNEDEDSNGGNFMANAGSAYIFERDVNGNWIEIQKINSSDRTAYDYFGNSVCMSGEYAIVGAYAESGATGAAYIFKRNSSGNWYQVQKITGSDCVGTEYFGVSVSISSNYAIVGAKSHDYDTNGANHLSSAGAAYIFERNIYGNWIEEQKIIASDRGIEDFFGVSVSINGEKAIVGAYYAKGMNNLLDAGSAYIFERNTSGNWLEVHKAVASDGEIYDHFGNSVDISGNYAIVSADREDEDSAGLNSLASPGSAYIYERNTNGNWNQVQKIVASNRASLSYFGYSASIENNLAIIGAYGHKSNGYSSNCGAAYIFERDNSGIWTETEYLFASDNDYGDWFGCSVSQSGEYFMMGAIYDEHGTPGGDTIVDAGSAYIFEPCISYSPISVSACDTYTSPSGNYTWYTGGNYSDTIVNTQGCDSIITINLIIYTVEASITQSGADLTANNPGASYQWLDCSNNFAIVNGATDQTYTAITNGDYAVEVTLNGCTDTSECVTVSTIGIIHDNSHRSVSITPNPTDGMININLGDLNNVSIKVFNIGGQLIYQETNIHSTFHQLEIEHAPGIYFIEINSKGWNQHYKLIKK